MNPENPSFRPEDEKKEDPKASELGKLVEAIFDQKVKIEKMEDALTLENKALAALEQKAVAWLEELQWDKFTHRRGTISINEKWRFNLPATDADKQAFFNYLRERGLYDKYATVNANAYNSFLLAEWEAEKQAGRGMDFAVPGVPEPKFFRALSTLKARSK